MPAPPIWAYGKGVPTSVCGTSWVQYNTTPGCTNGAASSPAVVCLNEDLNLNGVLDPGEDFNNDGKLEPGDVAVATPSSLVTGSDGSAPLYRVEYPEDHALWVQSVAHGYVANRAGHPEFDGLAVRSADTVRVFDDDDIDAPGLGPPLRHGQHLLEFEVF